MGESLGAAVLFLAAVNVLHIISWTAGLTRDVLLGRPPRILYSHAELYAVPAYVGGLATTLVLRWRPSMVMEARVPPLPPPQPPSSPRYRHARTAGSSQNRCSDSLLHQR